MKTFVLTMILALSISNISFSQTDSTGSNSTGGNAAAGSGNAAGTRLGYDSRYSISVPSGYSTGSSEHNVYSTTAPDVNGPSSTSTVPNENSSIGSIHVVRTANSDLSNSSNSSNSVVVQ